MNSTNFSHGRLAEDSAAQYLKKYGFEILDRNWRTRYCEIDIVAKKHQIIYFVEVKYRRSDSQGNGLDYITPAKLKQMTFAAELWLNDNVWDGDYSLSAIEVTGDVYLVGDFIEEI